MKYVVRTIPLVGASLTSQWIAIHPEFKIKLISCNHKEGELVVDCLTEAVSEIRLNKNVIDVYTLMEE